MELAISNLAWDPAEDIAVCELLTAAGVRAVELAPTKVWVNPSDVSAAEAIRYRAQWEERGFRLVAMQALLFGHPEMTIFETAEQRRAGHDYLGKVMELASRLGVGPLVYGAPKNRLVGSLSWSEALRSAASFFGDLGQTAARLGVQMCIEPNPKQYGCDFVNTIAEGVTLVQATQSPGFRLHVDASAMILNGEEIEPTLDLAFPHMSHFHISVPFLSLPDGRHETAHSRMAAHLRVLGYRGFVSIEMRDGHPMGTLPAIRQAVEFARRIYC